MPFPEPIESASKHRSTRKWAAAIGLFTLIAFAVIGISDRISTYLANREKQRFEIEKAGLENFEVRERFYRGIINQRDEAHQLLRERVSQNQLQESNVPCVPYFDYNLEGDDLVLEGGVYTYDATIADYPPGSVRPESAPNALWLITTLRSQVEKAVNLGNKSVRINIEILGCADGLRVRPGAVYQGDFGFVDTFYRSSSGEQIRLLVQPQSTPLTNEMIGALRAFGIQRILSESPVLAHAQTELGVATSEAIGGAYRRVLVRIRMAEIVPRVQIR